VLQPIPAVWHPAPPASDPREDTRDPQAFQDVFRRLGIKLRQRKAEKACHEPAAPWEYSYLPRCMACAVQPAQAEDRIGSEEHEWLCISCAHKRAVGRHTRARAEMALTMEEIAGVQDGSADRGRVAVLYADVDRAGGLMQMCRNETEVTSLSDHLWGATRAGADYVRDRFPGRYQSPIVGGDDLLLFLPNRRCVHTLGEVWTRVEDRLKSLPPVLQGTAVGEALEKKVSLSAGMLVADHHLPMRILFETAQALLAGAKRGSYRRGSSCLDFLTLDGGTPLSDAIETTRRASLERVFEPGGHFPEGGTLREVRRMRLTRKPYTRNEFAALLRDVEAIQRDADLQAALRSVARFLATDRPLEAYINIGYQLVRHEVRQRINPAHLYAVERIESESGGAVQAVTTSVFDLLELIDMEHERREDQRQ
jgi:hypothetical protein